METMYEVLRFVDQGADCRQTIDCLEGKLLIYYLQEQPEMEKQRLWKFLRQICIQVEKYQKSTGGQNYRCLTPYSILVSEEREVFLLNPDAEENEFVVRKLQQKAVRKHFQQSTEMGEMSSIRRADLFGIGKIMQFVLAYVEVTPELTSAEERKMMRIIERCTGESKNSYEEVRQIIKELPVDSRKQSGRKSGSKSKKKKMFLIAGIVLGVICVLVLFVYLKGYVEKKAVGAVKKAVVEAGTKELSEAAQDAQAILAGEQALDEWLDEKQKSGENPMEIAKETNDLFEELETQKEETEEEKELKALEEKYQILTDVKNRMEEELLSNTKEGNETVLFLGREMELYVVRALASAYEREEMIDEAIQAYGRLIEVESQEELICQAGIRKMKLEADRGQYARAVLTGEAVLEKVKESEEVEQLMAEYKNQAEGKENADSDEKANAESDGKENTDAEEVKSE